MAGDPPDFGAMYEQDIKQRAATIIAENPGMSLETALQKAEAYLRVNNPFIPPAHGCPVNDLPPELLAHIFELGRQMDDDDDYDGDYEEGIDLADEWETDDEEGDADEEINADMDVDTDTDVRMSSPAKRRTALAAPAPGPPYDSDEDAEVEEEEDGEEDDDDDDESDLAFQELVSHVCRHWREIAFGQHTLWTRLQFDGHPNFERARAWLERAHGLPLEITIDCTSVHGQDQDEGPDTPEVQPPPGGLFNILLSFDPSTGAIMTSTTTDDPLAPQEDKPEPQPCISLEDLIVILDMIIPHVQEWRILEVHVNSYTYMYEILQRLAQCAEAPLLEELGLYSYDDTEDYETFQPPQLATPFLPFHGLAPRLTHVAFWGVHIAWDESLTLLKGLRELELAYHAKDVRPSFRTFRAMLDASPEIELLSLCLSGTTGDMETVEVPSLRSLVLCYLEAEYAKPLMHALVLPALDELTLQLQEEDYTEFVTQLATPARGETRTLLAGLTSLKLTSLPCSATAAKLFMRQLAGLRRINLNCTGHDELQFFEMLSEVMPGSGVPGQLVMPVYCPKLDTLRVAGVEGAAVRKLVAVRKAAGAAVNDVSMSERDMMDPKDEKWLRANVNTFDFFEPSDSEEEVDDEDMDDGP
ncbi:hypothetical protein B0H11DRAFT_1978314 [Mycena galericulata]|nr:hypothetical protein B0H11DRAFT_1978314 [Mycena galericulata]